MTGDSEKLRELTVRLKKMRGLGQNFRPPVKISVRKTAIISVRKTDHHFTVSNSTVEIIRSSQANDKFCQSVINKQISSSELKKRELKLIDNSLLMKCNKIYVPDDRQLKTQLLEIYHDNK